MARGQRVGLEPQRARDLAREPLPLGVECGQEGDLERGQVLEHGQLERGLLRRPGLP